MSQLYVMTQTHSWYRIYCCSYNNKTSYYMKLTPSVWLKPMKKISLHNERLLSPWKKTSYSWKNQCFYVLLLHTPHRATILMSLGLLSCCFNTSFSLPSTILELRLFKWNITLGCWTTRQEVTESCIDWIDMMYIKIKAWPSLNAQPSIS